MSRRMLPVVLFAFCLGAGPGLLLSEEAGGAPGRLKAPHVRLRDARPVAYGDAKLVSLTLELSNPNSEDLLFRGYTPESFGPPLKDGSIAPMHQIELKRDGQWRAHPLGWCGTGMGWIPMSPGRSGTFEVQIPAGTGDAVRVGVVWMAAVDKPETAKTVWSEEIIWAEAGPRGKGADRPAKPDAPQPDLPTKPALRHVPGDVAGPASSEIGRLIQLGAKVTWKHGQATELNLTSSKIGDADMELLTSLPALEQLKLEACQNITDAALAYVKGLTKLKGLGLDQTNVTDAGLVHLQGLSGLHHLSFNATRVGDAGLKHLRGLTKLRVLYLNGTRVTGNGLVHLEPLVSLEWLDLGGSKVDDAGMAHLGALPRLRLLSLNGVPIGDAGLKHLTACRNLEGLSLKGARITDAGLMRLKDLPKLNDLDIEGTKVTVGGIDVLMKALPNCRIRHDSAAVTKAELKLPDAAQKAAQRYTKQLEAARAAFEAKQRAALTLHVEQLTRLQQACTAAGDLDGARAIQARIVELEGPVDAGLRMDELRGTWAATYSNGDTYERRFHGRNQVNKAARLQRRDGDLIIEYPDDLRTIERITIGQGRIFFEHFNPKSTYPEGRPALLGVGKKLE